MFRGPRAPWDPAGVDNLAKPCYDFKGFAAACDYLRDMNDALRKLGWGVYQSDHEDANAQYEINYKYADALTTADRVYRYRVTNTQIVKPEDVYVLDPKGHPTLTLVTCYPFTFIGQAPLRFVVFADLVEEDQRF